MAKKKRRRFSGTIMMLLPILLCGYVLFTLFEQQKEMAELKRQEAYYLEKIDKAEKEIEDINYRIENADSDEHIEKVAREQLKMIGSDEIIFIDMGKGGN
ncbi:FtsB family cell division protein [Alkaliphilus peptidifermentans]|uniref:Cell division protein DivIC n=1 Tax=Alkaliphilus peptidifermentans DSM 18978 TaxID=1120976 RepID=A0A1G5AJP5_9FIRM|nr:septum formation initiator family protein [Alkaliphilus peptidifermentans]SCX78081.1 cell division protein DivIC [Alkaliphilus peptidifermentans DSM 18978]